MTFNPVGMQTKFNNVVNEFGEVVRFRYFTESGADANYDDHVSLSKSGADYYVSGMRQPISNTRGSYDAILLEQGRIKQSDTKLYVPGVVNTSGMFRVGFGGNPCAGSEEYSVIENGIISQPLPGGQVIYKTIYLRYLPTGSLVQEE